uniref:RNA helicase n=1 Tax=Ciona savignyi TaxID=51511 RepID=H2Z460_CIOSA
MKDWGLPDCILDNYAMLGLNEMFKWQNECLSLPGVLDGKNLIVSAPTSAGKTLIVEVLIAKRVLGTHRKAILVFPFVSLAREKMFHLRRLFDGTGVTVDGYMGGLSPPGGFSSVDIAICTIEKANNIINKLIEEKSTEQIAMLVVDELHMIGDDGRGYLLELLLTKIRLLCFEASCLCQVIGLSATITNLDLFSIWLDGVVFQTNFRPVPLARYIKVGKEIFDENFIKQRDFEPQVTFMVNKEDDDDITALCYETTRNNHSVLMFCPTKKWCENLANQISKNFQQLNISTTEKHQGRASVLEQLKRSPAGLDPLLCSSIPYGVAFHHAGLTTEERDVLESGFRQGHLLILVATSTLSSGVNLPARRVIIRTPTFHRAVLQQRVYEQMTGRAGRKGESDTGESILICRSNERNQAKILASSIIPSVESCLVGKLQQKSTVRMERAILEVCSQIKTYPFIKVYIFIFILIACCLLSSNTPLKLLDDIIHTCVDWLVSNEFIYVQQYEQESQPESKKVAATQFGRASLFSSLPTDHSLQVLADLQVASRAFALDSELHIVYQITPLNVINDWALDWSRYLSIYENLSSSHQRVAVLIGIDEGVLTRMSLGGGRARVSNKLQQRITIHKRFYAALILHDILQEVPFNNICDKYDCNRGMVQALQQSAASFAGRMVTAFCHELVWWCMELLFNEFQSRLLFGVQRELLDLTRIPLLNNKRARGLYEAGLTTCKLVADAKTSYVESILRNACKFQSKRQLYGDNAWDVEDRRNLHVIKVVGSSEGLTESEAAVAIIAHAK